jgi:hypothetical protein
MITEEKNHAAYRLIKGYAAASVAPLQKQTVGRGGMPKEEWGDGNDGAEGGERANYNKKNEETKEKKKSAGRGDEEWEGDEELDRDAHGNVVTEAEDEPEVRRGGGEQCHLPRERLA